MKRKNRPTMNNVLLEVIRTLPNKSQTIQEVYDIAQILWEQKCRDVDAFNANYIKLESFLVQFFAQLGDEETIRKAIQYNTMAIAHFARKILEDSESDEYFTLDRICYAIRQERMASKKPRKKPLEKTPIKNR